MSKMDDDSSGIQTSGDGMLNGRTPSDWSKYGDQSKEDGIQKMDDSKERMSGKREASPGRLVRRQFVIDPIGGGYLLRRQAGPEPAPPAKKSFPLDPIGGGYLLKRDAMIGRYEGDPLSAAVAILREASYLREQSRAEDDKPRRGLSNSEYSIRVTPKEEILSTLVAGDSVLNNKNHHLIGMGMERFPIDPIGGGLLLGRSVSYDAPKSKSKYLAGKQREEYAKNRSPPGNYLPH